MSTGVEQRTATLGGIPDQSDPEKTDHTDPLLSTFTIYLATRLRDTPITAHRFCIEAIVAVRVIRQGRDPLTGETLTDIALAHATKTQCDGLIAHVPEVAANLFPPRFVSLVKKEWEKLRTGRFSASTRARRYTTKATERKRRQR